MSDAENSSSLDEYMKQESMLAQEPWYHYSLSREESERRIRRNGEFLVRSSTRTPGDFVLTYKWNGKVVHILVQQREQQNTANPANQFLYSFGVLEFPSVAQLIRYHWKNQLPMTVSSEAVIFRPVHYVDSKHAKGLPWKLGSDPIPTHEYGTSLLPPTSLSVTKLSGIAGSVSDVRGRFDSSHSEASTKGASLLDVRDTTYIDPLLLGDIDYGFPDLLTGSLGSLYMHSSQNSLFETSNFAQSSEQINTSKLGLMTPEANEPDPGSRSSTHRNGLGDHRSVSLTRQAIRYVDMHDPTEGSHPKPSGLEKLPPTHPCSPENVYRSVNYDLTRALPALLLHRTGPVERALDRKVWLELSHLLNKRVVSPLDYGAHLTLDLISLLLPTGAIDDPDRSVKLGVQGSRHRRLRRDLYNRDRFLRLFIIASVLMTDNDAMRANILEFWFELAQCLFTIFRDQHTLSTVLRAIFSSKIPTKIWKAATTGLDASTQSMKSAMIQELSAYHQALGGQVRSEKVEALSTPTPSASARLSINPHDWRTQIPNLHPFLASPMADSRRSKRITSDNNGPIQNPSESAPITPNESARTYLVKDLWMWELYSTMRDVNSLAACLSRTETILAMLLGPVKLERGPVLDKLYAKLSSVLVAVSKLIESDKQ